MLPIPCCFSKNLDSCPKEVCWALGYRLDFWLGDRGFFEVLIYFRAKNEFLGLGVGVGVWICVRVL